MQNHRFMHFYGLDPKLTFFQYKYYSTFNKSVEAIQQKIQESIHRIPKIGNAYKYLLIFYLFLLALFISFQIKYNYNSLYFINFY